MKFDALVERIETAPKKGLLRLVALVGAPASGKSTLSEAIDARIPSISVVPMDGFHLDNPLLEKRGTLNRKGAPETFDAAGFVHLIRRFAAGERPFYPLFDRALDRSIAGAGEIDERCETVLVEGNYLLFDHPDWRPLHDLWDLSIQVSVPQDVLRDRLMERWQNFGFDAASARVKAEGNDLPNAALVAAQSVAADITVETISL